MAFSVPQALTSLFRLSDAGAITGVRQPVPDGVDPRRWLLHWVFTPTYNRHSAAPAPALLDREIALEGTGAVSVLIVRAGEQFRAYQADCGDRYIVIALPPRMDVTAVPSLDRGVWIDAVARPCAETGGVGYARLFAQLLACHLGLGWIWMLDDNVHYCQRMDLPRMFAAGAEPRHAPLELCSFAAAMREVEAQLGGDGDETYLCPIARSELRIRDAVVTGTPACPAGAFLRPAGGSGGRGGVALDGGGGRSRVEVRRDFAGDSSCYGVIGLRRDARGYEDLRGPFAVTHSVYSFVLLNAAETVRRGVLYPPKPFWEDVEFNRLCEERGLAVLKCNRLFHFKKNLQPRAAGRLTGGGAAASVAAPRRVRVAVLPSAACDDGGAALDVELAADTDSYASVARQIRRALEQWAPGCLIVRIDATPLGAAQAVPLDPAPDAAASMAPADYLPLKSAEAWVLPAVGDADRFAPRKGPPPEPAERGPLVALRAWFVAHGLDPEGGPGVLAWPAGEDEDENRPVYGLARGVHDFCAAGLPEDGGGERGGECVVVLRAFQHGADALATLVGRFVNTRVQQRARALRRAFLVVPALLLAEGAAPARAQIEERVAPARDQGWRVGRVWASRRAEGGVLPVFTGAGEEAAGGVMEDGCFLLVLVEQEPPTPAMASSPAAMAASVSEGGVDSGVDPPGSQPPPHVFPHSLPDFDTFRLLLSLPYSLSPTARDARLKVDILRTTPSTTHHCSRCCTRGRRHAGPVSKPSGPPQASEQRRQLAGTVLSSVLFLRSNKL